MDKFLYKPTSQLWQLLQAKCAGFVLHQIPLLFPMNNDYAA
jgi:hypothetical protein